jgi:hypothetical protein
MAQEKVAPLQINKRFFVIRSIVCGVAAILVAATAHKTDPSASPMDFLWFAWVMALLTLVLWDFKKIHGSGQWLGATTAAVVLATATVLVAQQLLF